MEINFKSFKILLRVHRRTGRRKHARTDLWVGTSYNNHIWGTFRLMAIIRWPKSLRTPGIRSGQLFFFFSIPRSWQAIGMWYQQIKNIRSYPYSCQELALFKEINSTKRQREENTKPYTCFQLAQRRKPTVFWPFFTFIFNLGTRGILQNAERWMQNAERQMTLKFSDQG